MIGEIAEVKAAEREPRACACAIRSVEVAAARRPQLMRNMPVRGACR